MIKEPPNDFISSLRKRVKKNIDCVCPTEKWWLISDEDMKTIKEALNDAIRFEIVHFNNEFKHKMSQTLHTLDSGCHGTDAIPSDCQEREIEQIKQERARALNERFKREE